MSVRFDPPGAPDYYPGFSTAAIDYTIDCEVKTMAL